MADSGDLEPYPALIKWVGNNTTYLQFEVYDTISLISLVRELPGIVRCWRRLFYGY